MGPKKIKSVINAYKKELRERIKINKVILFGSYAQGLGKADSDIDLVILSPNFKDLSIEKRFSLLYQVRQHPLTIHNSMDIFGYTPEEYEKASRLTTLGEVKETGIEV